MNVYPHDIRLRTPWRFRTIGGVERAGDATIPGRWADWGLTDYWGEVELTRPFHWAAKLQADEQVVLRFDQCVGRMEARLNGTPLGGLDLPFGGAEFDVTPLLRPQNQLVVRLDAPWIADFSANPYGTLGCVAGDVGGRRRTPVGGILGGVVLSVRSRRIAVGGLQASGAWCDGAGVLRIEGQYQSHRPNLHLRVDVDDQTVFSSTLREPGEWRKLEANVAVPNASPWRPRSGGVGPRLNSLSIQVADGDVVCHQRLSSIGFPEHSLERPGPLGEIWPDRSFLPCFGEDPAARFDEWSLARLGTLRVVGHVAPDDLYRLCDRAGMPVVQDLFPAVGVQESSDEALWRLESVLKRLAEHPCLAAWNIPGNWPQLYRAAPDRRLVEAALRADVHRPVLEIS